MAQNFLPAHHRSGKVSRKVYFRNNIPIAIKMRVLCSPAGIICQRVGQIEHIYRKG